MSFQSLIFRCCPDVVTVNLQPVGNRKDSGDRNFLGANIAIVTAGTGNLNEGTHFITRCQNPCVFFFREHTCAGAVCVGQILLHLLRIAHAAENHIDFRHVPQEVQGTFHGRFGQHIGHFLRHIGNGTATKGLHNHHSQALFMGKAQTFHTGLIIHIHVV